MSLMNAFSDLKPQRIEVGKFYVGTVVANNDLAHFGQPLGRVKFRLPLLFEGIPDELLPWALPRPARFKGGQNNGNFSVPTIGTKILVEFQSHDVYNPFYTGYPFAFDSYIELLIDDPVDRKEYPKKHLIYCFDNGNFLAINDEYEDTDERFKLKLTNVGNVVFWFGKNYETSVKDDYALTVQDKYEVKAQENLVSVLSKQNYQFKADKNSKVTIQGLETCDVMGASTHSYFSQTTRNFLKGLTIISQGGAVKIVLDSHPFDMTSGGSITVSSKRDISVTGLNVTVTADSWLKLRGTKITKSVEIDFENGQSTQEMIKQMVKAEVGALAATLSKPSSSSSTSSTSNSKK